MMKWILLTLFPFIFMGCAGPHADDSLFSASEVIDSLVIRNATSKEMLDVELYVPDTGMVVGYNRILPMQEHELEFSPRKNQNRESYLWWVHDGEKYQQRLKPLLEKYSMPNRLHQIVIVVGARGSVQAAILPE